MKNNISRETLRKARTRILRKSLRDADAFERMLSFFNFLFVEGPQDKPVEDRRFIIITRRGFLLWVIASLCGFCGDRFEIGSSFVISDRLWQKMSNQERKEFVSNKHIFIVDDVIVSGKSASGIYNSIPSGECKSKFIAILNACDSFSEETLMETLDDSCVTHDCYRSWGSLSENARRLQGASIMVAIHNLAVPFTADSAVYHSLKVRQSVLERWLRLCGDKDSRNWKCEPAENTDLDFGGAGVVRSVFYIHAPALPSGTDGFSNFFSRGMRVCYRLLSKEEDADAEFAEVAVVPWVLFDVLDYSRAEGYLARLSGNDSWISNNLNVSNNMAPATDSSDTERRRHIVHRAISYLLSKCLAEKFFNDMQSIDATFAGEFFAKTDEYENYSIHHINKRLLAELDSLVGIIDPHKDGGLALYNELGITSDAYTEIRSEVLSENSPTPIGELGDILCYARDGDGDLSSLRAFENNQFPLIACSGGEMEDKRGVATLMYVRSSAVALKSILFNSKHRGKLLLKTVSAGENCSLALIKNYDFVWALNHLNKQGLYTPDAIMRFKEYWNENSSHKVTDYIVRTLKHLGPEKWADISDIRDSYETDAPLSLATRIADEFAQLEHR